MRRAILFTLGMPLLAALIWAAPQTRPEGSLRCTLTDKVIEKCCCEQREGKLYCPLAKKSIEKCCCVPAQSKKQ